MSASYDGRCSVSPMVVDFGGHGNCGAARSSGQEQNEAESFLKKLTSIDIDVS